MTDEPTPNKPNANKANSDKTAPDGTTAPQPLSLEARLAEYGTVLRDEIKDSTGKVAAIAAYTNPADATADRDTGGAEMGAGTAPAQRGKHRRTGLLVAAVLALIAGVGVFSLQDREPDRTIQIASSPTTALDDDSNDPSANDEDPGSDAATDPTPDPAPTHGDAGTDAGPDQTDTTTVDPDGDPGGGPDRTPTGPPIDVFCEEGTLQGNVCVIVGDPPIPGPDVCPVSTTVFEDAQGCYRIVPLSADCAGLTIVNATSCREPVELVPPPTECPTGFTLRAFDETCTRPAASRTICTEGILEQGQCVVTGTAAGTTCPDGADIVEEDGQCFRIEEADCGDLTPVANTNECRAQGSVVDTPTCAGTPPPPAFAPPVVDGLCVVTAPLAEYCNVGVLEDSECVRIEPFEEIWICPESSTVFEDPTGCWEFLAFLPDGSCPDGMPTPDGTQCIRDVPLEPLPECFGTPVVDPVTGFDMCEFRDPAVLSCDGYDYPNPSPEELPGICLRFDGPPTQRLTCTETGAVVATPADCFTTTSAACDVPGCRTPVESIVSATPCSTGFELGPNNTCIRFASPVTECIDGELDRDGRSCVVLGVMLGGPATCPSGDDIIADATGCYRLVPRTDCGDRAEIDGGCRTTVALQATAPRCPQQGFGPVDNQCVSYQQPVSLPAADE